MMSLAKLDYKLSRPCTFVIFLITDKMSDKSKTREGRVYFGSWFKEIVYSHREDVYGQGRCHLQSQGNVVYGHRGDVVYSHREMQSTVIGEMSSMIIGKCSLQSQGRCLQLQVRCHLQSQGRCCLRPGKILSTVIGKCSLQSWEQENKEASHVASTVRKQKKMIAGASLSLIYPGTLAYEIVLSIVGLLISFKPIQKLPHRP